MSYHVFTAGKLREMTTPNSEAKLFRSASEVYWVNLVNKDHNPALKSELHDTETDIYVVTEGEGEISLGGTLIDPTSPKPGQHRGSGLDGAETFPMRVGDVFIIPEGTPHMVDTRNSSLVYMVIKIDVAV